MAFLRRGSRNGGSRNGGTQDDSTPCPRPQVAPPARDWAESMDPELAFEAAVALALSCGAISRAGEAVREASHFTGSAYALMGPGAVTLKRIPLADLVAELERQARIHGSLEHYRLRFRPRRTTVIAALLAGFTALLSMQAWMNQVSERRIAELERGYLDHQNSLVAASGSSATSGTELATIETVADFEQRLLRAQFDGCYSEVKADLAKATDQLVLAHQSRGAGRSPQHLVDASGAYQVFKESHRSCRNARFLSFSRWWRP